MIRSCITQTPKNVVVEIVTSFYGMRCYVVESTLVVDIIRRDLILVSSQDLGTLCLPVSYYIVEKAVCD